MNRIFKIALLGLFSAVSLISCGPKDDDFVPTPPLPYAQQYPVDIANIDKFLDENHMELNGADTDNTKDPIFTRLPEIPDPNIKSIREQYITPYPAADRIKTVTRDGIDYKIYFIPFAQGGGKQPMTVDSVFVSYKGQYLSYKQDAVIPTKTNLEITPFDENQNPDWLYLAKVVQGWREIIPLFKGSTSHSQNPNGTTTFNNFGAGIMFLPSAFGYYSSTASIIPPYSPLMFTFKLMEVNYVDDDYDRIDSRDEDVNGNGILSDDDTDGDGFPNYLDQDDDGDSYFTKYEIANPLGGYYTVDNIPLCSDGKKRHLSSLCHQP